VPTYHVDIETRSRADLKKVGAHRYARDPSTEILCIAIAEEENDPVVWHKEPILWNEKDLEHLYNRPAEKLLEKISRPDSVVYAHNAQFEIACLDALMEKTTGFKPPAHHQWRCTAAMGRRAALPASLEKLAETLNLKNLKDNKGKSLIRKFSIPQTAGKKKGEFIEPQEEIEAFKEFCDYCIQDVRVEQEIHKTLKDFELTGFPLQTFLLDIEINCRGFPVNLDALRKAEKLVNEETERLETEFLALTGLKPSQGAKLLVWLKERGFKHDNLQAATLEEFFETFDEEDEAASPELKEVLKIKKHISFASLKKIPTMISCAGPQDNRVRGTHTYHGAGTGRWSASLVQPQNFKKPAPYMESLSPSAYKDIQEGCNTDWLRLNYGPPLEVIASCIRHFIQDGKPMLSADYSAIEARLLAWQADEKWKLEVFKGHGKIYEAAACQMFGVTMKDFDDYKKEHGKHHPLRQKAKAGELACGYAGGTGALVRMGALKQGLTKKELPGIIMSWREANPSIVKMWGDIERASKTALMTPGKVFPFGKGCAFFSTHTAGMKYLFMRLPSGRKIAYPKPEIVPQLRWTEVTFVKDEDGELVEELVMKKLFNPTEEQIARLKHRESLGGPLKEDKKPYIKGVRLGEAITVFSQLPKTVHWGRVEIHPGIFCNNQIQGIAGDFMANGLLQAEAAGYPTLMIIHDEDLAQYDLSEDRSPNHFVECLTKLPPWAEGMPLAAEGGVVEFYQK
jgi:DNA polymerase